VLTLSGIQKSFGERVLFSDATLQVNRLDRIGLVGPNGAGKTTLFSFILGQSEPDAGTVTMERGISFGYLPQETAAVGDETVVEVAASISPEYTRLRRIIKAWEADHPVEALHPELVHDDVHDRFNELGGFRLESEAKQILKGLGFRDKDFDRQAREMSGGWVMRAHLARLLVQQPDLLLLDEPTNHLDLEALLWFQDYLKKYPGAILVISHDREFLNQLVGQIVEIRQGRLLQYRGNYDDFLEQRDAYEQQLLAAYKHQEREIARLMTFVNRFRAKNTKATQAKSKLKQIERMEKVEAPGPEDARISFQFPQPQQSGRRVISLKGIHHAYGSNVVYRGVDFEAQRGQRIVLVGPNGAGKSTLLKLLAGVIQPQQGSRELGHNTKSGYYSQYRMDMFGRKADDGDSPAAGAEGEAISPVTTIDSQLPPLNPQLTVLEEAMNTRRQVGEQGVRTLLGCFLFRGDDVFKPVRVLSGGEKSRLALVKLLLDPPNLLLMDEPTTHLDMSSIDALAYALDQYEGTLIFISHDVYFIRSLANHVVHIDSGRLTHYPGGYDYYLEKTKASSARDGLTAGTSQVRTNETARPEAEAQLSRKDIKRIEAEKRQARSRELRSHESVVSTLEAKIHELEARQEELTRLMENPATYEESGKGAQVSRELVDVRAALQECMAEWEQAAAKLEEIRSVSG
jgi:ATP-binding cassette subfamily F protein 3